MKFANLLRQVTGELNRFTLAQQELQAKGIAVTNLFSPYANVGEEGPYTYPRQVVDRALREGLQKARPYAPDSFGQRVAREGIRDYYARRKVSVCPEQILLTPGSSLAYLYLFRLLADLGEEFLCPSPSYPLFDTIAQFAGVTISHYPIQERQNPPFWSLNVDELENRITTKTKAIIIISPHNPTGFIYSQDCLEKIGWLAKRHGIALIHDEVFSEFVYEGDFARAVSTPAPLVFTLNGLSKSFHLPGLKLGWVVVSGEEEFVRKAMAGLEMLADTFLPVNEAVQFALPEILAEGEKFLEGYTNWISDRRLQACSLVEATGWGRVLPPEGGFYLPVRISDAFCPEGDDERIAVKLLRAKSLLLHPGSFYDMTSAHLILSFHHPVEILQKISS